MCLAQGPQRSDAGEARTRYPSVSSQALYHWATALPNDPRGEAIFGPRGIIHKVMLRTKYHGSRPNGFRQEDVFMFLPI